MIPSSYDRIATRGKRDFSSRINRKQSLDVSLPPMHNERSNPRLISKSPVDEQRSPSSDGLVRLPNLVNISPLNERRNLIAKAYENRDHL